MLQKIHAVLRIIPGDQICLPKHLEAVQKRKHHDRKHGGKEIGKRNAEKAFPVPRAVYPGRVIQRAGNGSQPGRPEHDIVPQIPPYIAEHQHAERSVCIHPVRTADRNKRKQMIQKSLVMKQYLPENYHRGNGNCHGKKEHTFQKLHPSFSFCQKNGDQKG